MEGITELFCLVDDFCQLFEPEWKKTLLPKPGKKKRDRACNLSLSELMTLVILFHLVGYRYLKGFYQHASDPLSKEFPGLPGYDRFVALMPRIVIPLVVLLEMLKGKCTGLSIVDSMPIAIYDNHRINRHRVFKSSEARGKSSMGWFLVLVASCYQSVRGVFGDYGYAWQCR